MDRLSDTNMAAVLARLEFVPIEPPAELTDESARAMFVAIATNNRSRPWNQSHAFALADYCRISALWNRELNLAESEGFMVEGKPNKRLTVVANLSRERVRLGRVLGLHIGTRNVAGSNNKATETQRKLGAHIADSANTEHGDLLS